MVQSLLRLWRVSLWSAVRWPISTAGMPYMEPLETSLAALIISRCWCLCCVAVLVSWMQSTPKWGPLRELSLAAAKTSVPATGEPLEPRKDGLSSTPSPFSTKPHLVHEHEHLVSVCLSAVCVSPSCACPYAYLCFLIRRAWHDRQGWVCCPSSVWLQCFPGR
jgi:hypothetical protein